VAFLLAPALLAAEALGDFSAAGLHPHKPLPQSTPPTVSPPPAADQLPGETMENAIPVPSLPFEATGSNCGYANDYAVMCPYGNWAPDVVYAFTPAEETNIRIDLCNSGYDTLVFLYHTDHQHLLACNDDLCGPDGYRSAIERLHVVPGYTYYIVVDGYTDNCGDYVLEVTDLGPCIPDCTAIWEEEGEPNCGDGYVDDFNAGCDAFPIVFRPIAPSEHIIRICGTSGWYWSGDSFMFDRDWYEIQVPVTSPIDVACDAEFDVSLTLYWAINGCGNLITLDQDDGLWCESMAQVSGQLEPGTYWIKVRPIAGAGGCGLGYRLWIDGYVPGPTGVGDPAFVAGAQLQPPSPNPFRSSTSISYSLARSGTGRIAIYDLAGRLVRTLTSETLPVGPGRIGWDGRDEAGRQVASGIYECRLETASGTVTRPLIRLR
jgi:hypothetical protein